MSKTEGHRHGPGSSLSNRFNPTGSGNGVRKPSYLSFSAKQLEWFTSEGLDRAATIEVENTIKNIDYTIVDPAFTGYAGYHNHTFIGTQGNTGAASGNTASATPTFTGKQGNTAGGGGLDSGNEGGDEARPINISYRMWQRVA